ncbi:DUF4160 domain-containing protein [Flavihumibacter sediminis]|nr:DUF4160 domain-containing protein [Flavihumibacter sediminis]
MMEDLQNRINRYINDTIFWPSGEIVWIKHLIHRKRNMKIEMYPNDHNPPHFHVKSKCGSINATFGVYTGDYLKGTINGNDILRIKAFHHEFKDKLIEYWEQKVIKQR